MRISNYIFGTLGILLITGLILLITCSTYIDNHEFGYKFDARTGKLDSVGRKGYVFEWPMVRVNTIDLRPIQICINANSRVLNCKLVRFNPSGYKTFIDWHGRGNYDEYKLYNVLMSYAYDGTNSNYPFLIIDKQDKDISTPVNEVKDTLNIK